MENSDSVNLIEDFKSVKQDVFDALKSLRHLIVKRKLLFACVSLVLVIATCSWAGLYLYQRHEKEVAAKQAAAQFDSNLSHLKDLNNEYYAVFRQFVSLPSSTTKTQSEWDSYYSGLTSQLQPVKNAVNKTYGNNSVLNGINNNLTTATDDLINLLTLEKSYQDMSFQVTNDKATLSTEQGDLDNEISIYNTAPEIGSGYVDSVQSDVDTAQSQLNTDEQTQTQQEAQIKNLLKTVLQDSLALTTSSTAAGL